MMRPLRAFTSGKNINPQWAPDGKSVYFLSDRTGITNVYRADVSSEKVFQLTDLLSGVSGITALSPALTSAAKADRPGAVGLRSTVGPARAGRTLLSGWSSRRRPVSSHATRSWWVASSR